MPSAVADGTKKIKKMPGARAGSHAARRDEAAEDRQDAAQGRARAQGERKKAVFLADQLMLDK